MGWRRLVSGIWGEAQGKGNQLKGYGPSSTFVGSLSVLHTAKMGYGLLFRTVSHSGSVASVSPHLESDALKVVYPFAFLLSNIVHHLRYQVRCLYHISFQLGFPILAVFLRAQRSACSRT
jgi:hypothetical protein